MYKRILLAYDGSREGLIALREGALLAKQCGAQAFLLSVLSSSDLGVPTVDGVHVDVVHEQLAAYEALLQRGVAVAKQLGLDPVSRLVTGEPTAQIGAFAAEIDADLVVLGHRRKNLLQRWWSGPSGAYITDQVRCSVLIGRNAISDEAFEAELQGINAPVEPTVAEAQSPADARAGG
ncbi:MAG TPA: universal stress protein [Caulobacteraceae bacterium]|nr:universal stress protein [Caulobacteraceae bacterium]